MLTRSADGAELFSIFDHGGVRELTSDRWRQPNVLRLAFSSGANAFVGDPAEGPQRLFNGMLVSASEGPLAALAALAAATAALAAATAAVGQSVREADLAGNALDPLFALPAGASVDALPARRQPARIAWEQRLGGRLVTHGVPAEIVAQRLAAVP